MKKDVGTARASADSTQGVVLATVEIAAPPERVFRALTSDEIIDWWARPGVFDTREWSGDVRVGGRWRATGVARGQPYTLEGEFVEIDPPRKLVHTWHLAGAPAPATTVTYVLEAISGGTHLTVRHSGFPLAEPMTNTSMGWESSLQRLSERLSRGPQLADRQR